MTKPQQSWREDLTTFRSNHRLAGLTLSFLTILGIFSVASQILSLLGAPPETIPFSLQLTLATTFTLLFSLPSWR